MKGNEKIAFTAEAVAFMRSAENTDKFSKYFVSQKIKDKFKLFNKIAPKYLKMIARRRVELSDEIDKTIASYKPKQIIELACGYSPRGLILTKKDPKLIYIETDFPSVINRKREIIETIKKKENLKLNKNHSFIELDAIRDNLSDSLKNKLSPKKKTLVVAETLSSYLNTQEHEFLINNITKFLNEFDNGAYLSHEGFGMLKGTRGKLLLIYRDFIAKTRSHQHFKNSEEIKEYFQNKGFKRIKTSKSEKSRNITYLAQIQN